ncbi:hypothetical protein ABTC43_19120, partial [Acinetobacter baumannii]
RVAVGILLRREQRRLVARGRRRVLGVVVLGAVRDATVPGVVIVRRPVRGGALALAVPGGAGAVAVGRVPIGPVDPELVVVGRADIDVLGEGH